MNDLITPCLILDVERVRRNAERISSIAAANNVRLRPHIKTHKCIEVARIQTAGHDGGVTVSTLAEARAFAVNGFDDITYAVPIEAGKFPQVFEIIRGGTQLNVITDDLETMRLLNDAAIAAGVRVSVFLEIDCGDHRCGVEADSDEVIDIPRFLAGGQGVSFAGILTHAGHSYNVRTSEEIEQIAHQERDLMVYTAERIQGEGIAVPTVSIGSTPTITHIDHLDGVDEIRPGNYIFFDGFQATQGNCGFDDCGLTVLTAVTHISHTYKKIVVDAGAIALSKDRGPVDLDTSCGYGRVLDVEGNDLGLRLDSLSQEHGEMHVADDGLLKLLKVGTRLRILANHSCLTAAQHTHYNVLEGGRIVDRWQIHTGW